MDKPVNSLNRDDWVDAALAQLTEHGIERVSIAALSRELSVTKGSFYYHFKDRDDLLLTMLDHWRETGTEQALETVERVGGDAARKLRHLADITFRVFGGQMRLELALRDWGRKDERVWAVIQKVDERRMDYLRIQFLEIFGDEKVAEVKTWLLYCLFNGESSITIPPQGQSRTDVMWACFELLIGRQK